MSKKKIWYICLVSLIAIFMGVAYFSYAFFIKSDEYSGKLNIVAGTLNYKIESLSLNELNQISLMPGETELFNIDVISLNTIDSKYAIYYSSECNNINIGYLSINNLPMDNIAKDGKKRVTIKATNNCSNVSTITFGVQGGFKDNKIINDSSRKYLTQLRSVESTDIMYSNPSKTSCTNIQCAIDELSDIID